MSNELEKTGRALVVLKPDIEPDVIENLIRTRLSRLTEFHQVVAGDTRPFAYFPEYGVAMVSVPASVAKNVFGDVAESIEDEHRSLPSSLATFEGDDPGDTYSPLSTMDVLRCRRTGAGIKVALLDTGVDPNHPDLPQQTMIRNPILQGFPVDDDDGHGTHCAGLIVGPRKLPGGPGYGVAPDATLLVGRVLRPGGMGLDVNIIAGISWAEQQGASVIALCLGCGVRPFAAASATYERVAFRAIHRGALIVAAAGNRETRADEPVNRPANCPSIMAVGALDRALNPAPFSCRRVEGGDWVDAAAPGVAIRSSYLTADRRYLRMSGTSMATALVAGIAALWAEKGFRGRNLWDAVVRSGKRFSAPVDAPPGCVHAP